MQNKGKKTIQELMDTSVPSWGYGDVMISFKEQGLAISKTTILRHRNGEEPSWSYRKMYAKIFGLDESEINFTPNGKEKK